MIDLHSHLLPNIDDGSNSMKASLRLAQDAVNNGVKIALMTPHHRNGQYINHKNDVVRLTEEFQNQLDNENISLQVFPSQEVRINGELLNDLDNNDILFADERNRYLLLEFPNNDVPIYSSYMIFRLMQRGISVQIAHPERNTKIMDHPDILYHFIEKGAVAQITASSYVGNFGKKIQKFSESIVAHNLSHVFVSDVHDLPNRNYEMREAFEKLVKDLGEPYKALFETNAEAIFNGKYVNAMIPEPIVKHRFFNGF